MTTITSRDVPVKPSEAALLFVDVQNYGCDPRGSEYAGLDPAEREAKLGYFLRTLRETALPNMVRLRAAAREAGVEVIYTVIESLTRDGRDRGLDYKVTGFHVPPGSWDAKMVDDLLPGPDEMVFPKTSSSVFISTNLDYILRNLGTRYLIVAGCLTDQCVDSAVRDACDIGYLVTTVTDACATHSEERHVSSLRNSRGYSRQVTTEQIVAELAEYRVNADNPV
ncbi:isochorismatase family cysteine hydrolase [Novosphingobium sp. Fuku2-ISO-50]|uniref:isochorismatase family cysteine hydrolase n=1 Tax=Novosphingobium sp. Fuku2-ISO-50 TaxID=1739114 RepID=UPI000A936F14|nr:isochorismatase family cysteine hydrolase [Novosphingobium sp. Fuku2-ISO-50]